MAVCSLMCCQEVKRGMNVTRLSRCRKETRALRLDYIHHVAKTMSILSRLITHDHNNYAPSQGQEDFRNTSYIVPCTEDEGTPEEFFDLSLLYGSQQECAIGELTGIAWPDT